MHSRSIVVVCLLIALLLLTDADARTARVKRRLVYLKNARFFARLNIKEDLFPYSTVFAFAYGFTVLYELPTDAKQVTRHRIHRRDIFNDLEAVMNRHGFDGRACIMRSLCEATLVTKSHGLFQRLLKHLFTVPEREKRDMHPYHAPSDCDLFSSTCPVSLMNLQISPLYGAQ